MRKGWPLGLGMLLALCMTPLPLGFLVPLLLARPLYSGGFAYGFWLGVGFWALHLIWLPFSFTVLFNTAWGAVIFIPLILIKALMWGGVFGLTPGRPLARVGLWVVLEYLTSLGPLAFPWGLLGYALVDSPGRVLASLGGVYGLSLAVLGVALVGQWGWQKLKQDGQIFSVHGLSLVGVLALWLGLWAMPLPALVQGDQWALLVQGNTNPLHRNLLQDQAIYYGLTQSGLSQTPQTTLVVWPESAVWSFPADLEALLQGRTLLSGTFIGDYNSTVRWQNGQIWETYSKNRLVPFGESFPFQAQLPGVYRFFFRALGFQGDLRSQVPANRYPLLGHYGAYICYESVFPSVTRTLVQAGAQVLELGSNDAWFGPSFGGLQHFQMGRLRAVETGRWLLRAGNDGVTAIIDPYGRIVERIPQHTQGFLSGRFALSQTQTPYVRYGDWAVVLAGALGAIGLLYRPRPRII